MVLDTQSCTFESDWLPGNQIRRHIERLAFEVNRTLRTPSSDAVHDLRVAIRRLAQALVTFKDHLVRKAVKRIRRKLKAVLSAAGRVRDCDIAIKILSRTKRPGAGSLLHQIGVRRRGAERALLASLKRLSLCTHVSYWCDDLSLPSHNETSMTALAQEARGNLPQLAQRFFDAGKAASQTSGERLHEFRILAKRFRYTLELFVPVYSGSTEEWMREIKKVQSTLGAMNDYRTVHSLATDLRCENELRAALKRSEHRLVRQFRQIWGERFSDKIATQWIEALKADGDACGISRKPTKADRAAPLKALALRA
jgi:CHAD domain-containing protein